MSAAVELVVIPGLIAGTGLASFAAGRMHHTSAGGRHPGFVVAGPAGGGSRPQAAPQREPEPEPEQSAPSRRPPRRRGRAVAAAVTGIVTWAALVAYLHVPGVAALIVAVIVAVVTWSKTRPGRKDRRRSHGR